MDDWRIINQEYFLKGVELKKIKFPEFWKESYLAKNDFYEMISKDAFDFVEKYNRGKEFLEGEKIQKFWHTHLIFALKKSQQKIRGFVIVLWIIQLGYAKIVLMISVKSLILNCNRLAIIND